MILLFTSTIMSAFAECRRELERLYIYIYIYIAIWILFQEHSRFTGQKGKGEALSLTPLYNFHPLHSHLYISRAITAESSPLHIGSSWTRTGNLRFRAQVANHEAYIANHIFCINFINNRTNNATKT